MKLTNRNLIIIAALVAFFTMCLCSSGSPTKILSKKPFRKIAQIAEEKITTAIKNPMGSLPDVPRIMQTGPSTLSGLEPFGQEATVPPRTMNQQSAGCPSFSEMVVESRKNTPLRTDDRAMSGFMGTDDPFHPVGGGDVQRHDWEKNFENSVAGGDAQFLASLLPKGDPSRNTVMSPPNATAKSDLRADEPIKYDPNGQLMLLSNLTKLQTPQGL